MLKYFFLIFFAIQLASMPAMQASILTEQNPDNQSGEQKKQKPKKKRKKQRKDTSSAQDNSLKERAVVVKYLTGRGTRTWESTSIMLNGSPLTGRISYTFDAMGHFQEINQDMPMRSRWQLLKDLKSISLFERQTAGGPETGEFIFQIKELTDQKLVVQYIKPSGRDAGAEMIITFRAIE